MTTTLSVVESAKRQAAYRAVDEHFPPHARFVGIGSGSTVVYVVERIVQLGRDITDSITFIPTGYQSKELIINGGLKLGSIDRHTELDIAFDGADEVDPYLNCIKGGGACLFQEKLVAICAKKFVVVADYRKLSPSLSTHYTPGIPIEVVPPAATYVLSRLLTLGAVNPAIRMGGTSKAGPCITDNGNFIIDAPFPDGFIPSPSSPLSHPHKPLSPALSAIPVDAAAVERGGERVGGMDILGKEEGHPGAAVGMGVGSNEKVEGLAKALKGMVGVVEHGIFWSGDRKPIVAYFGMEDGRVELRVVPYWKSGVLGIGSKCFIPLFISDSSFALNPISFVIMISRMLEMRANSTCVCTVSSPLQRADSGLLVLWSNQPQPTLQNTRKPNQNLPHRRITTSHPKDQRSPDHLQNAAKYRQQKQPSTPQTEAFFFSSHHTTKQLISNMSSPSLSQRPTLTRLIRYDTPDADQFVLLHATPTSATHPLNLKLHATEGERAFATTIAQSKIYELRAKSYNGTSEDLEKIFLALLLKRDARIERGVELAAAVDGRGVTLTVRQDIGGIKQRIAALQIPEAEVEIPIFEWAVEACGDLNSGSSQLGSLQSKVESQEKEIEALTKQLKDLAEFKKEHEEMLLVKFSELLNSKKSKIRELSRELEIKSGGADPVSSKTQSPTPEAEVPDPAPTRTRGRGRGRAKPTAPSTRKRKPTAPPTDSESDGFVKMDLDSNKAKPLPADEDETEDSEYGEAGPSRGYILQAARSDRSATEDEGELPPVRRPIAFTIKKPESEPEPEPEGNEVDMEEEEPVPPVRRPRGGKGKGKAPVLSGGGRATRSKHKEPRPSPSPSPPTAVDAGDETGDSDDEL
ncbi:hypothetical protein L873DRAFT_1767181 [Choiromyces venosus 120613-1]|uniref:Ribose-5-phosphate isomerase n=1 Tax=Choiromyces venosus 120613-1 TaxID=1336337 RepID=A0A3N4JMQ0_9PEZI|nr:hypothetical protein L873DRAFT_1767181 [Choiromyces venosus 120613-1]